MPDTVQTQTLPTSSPEENGRTSENRSWFAAEWLIIVLGSAVLLTGVLQGKPLLSANDRSRWATVWSLVERHTFVIDEIDARPGWGTIDKVRHNEHYYSSKPPLLSATAAGIYWFDKRILGHDILRQTDEVCHLVLLVLNWLPISLSFWVMSRVLRRLDAAPLSRLIALSAYCFATLVTGYATTLNNHSPAAACALFSVAAALRAFDGPAFGRRHAVIAGFFAALTTSLELPAALLATLLIGWLYLRQGQRAVWWFLAGAIVPALMHFGLNWAATGDWRPFYAAYGSTAYRYVVDGVPSYWMNPRGLDQNLDSPLVYLLHCTIGHHGIFSLTPIYLLLLLSWVRPLTISARLLMLLRLSMTLTMVVLGFYLLRTENYNYGGNSFGLRWMIWITPFWIFALLPALEQLGRHRAGVGLALLLLGASTASSVAAARNPWASSWLYQQMEAAGWIDYSDPPLPLPQRTLHGCFPHLADHVPKGEWVEFTSTATGSSFADRRPDVLRITSLGVDQTEGQSLQLLEVKWNAGRADEMTQRIAVKVAGFESGRPLKEVLADAGSNAGRVLSLLRGLPFENPYRYGTERYLKSSIRTDAFLCRRAASEIIGRAAPDAPRVRHRCDLWLSDEVPFGTVQIEITELDVDSRELLTRRLFRLTAFHSDRPAPVSTSSK